MAPKKVTVFGEDEATAMLAQALTFHAFRTPLEDLHSGTIPDSLSGDFGDVKVVTPYGEIPWNRLSRISDDEMKALMIEVTARLYTLLVGLDDRYIQTSISALAHDSIRKWNAPEIREGLREAITHPTAPLSEDVVRQIAARIVACESQRKRQPN